MYQGAAILRRPKRGIARTMLAISACVLVPLGLWLLGAPSFLCVLPLLAAPLLSRVISGAIQPSLEPVSLLVDARGIFVEGALLTRNEDVLEAYLRGASAAVRTRHFSAPAQPMTVEIVTAAGYYGIDGGEPARTEAILAALGRPVVFCTTMYVPRTKSMQSERRTVWLATVGPILVFTLVMFSVLGGFLAYMYWLHQTGLRR